MSDTTCPAPACSRPRYGRKEYCRKHQGAMDRNGTLEPQKRGPKPENARGCLIDGCDEPHKGYGYCRNHLRAEKNAGRISDGNAGCGFAGCTRPHHANGLCETHENQRRRGIQLRPIGKYTRQDAVCRFDPCDNPPLAGNLCSGHDYQQRAGKELTPLRVAAPKGVPCSANEHPEGSCDRGAEKAGMCETHRRRFLRGEESWFTPVREKAPAGTGFIDEAGYRVISVAGQRYFEHRWLAEQLLGRPLLDTENVHHVDGQRDRNEVDGPFVMDERGRLRSGNLEVWSTAQPAGQEIGPKMQWAMTLIKQYGYLLRDEERQELAAALA